MGNCVATLSPPSFHTGEQVFVVVSLCSDQQLREDYVLTISRIELHSEHYQQITILVSLADRRHNPGGYVSFAQLIR